MFIEGIRGGAGKRAPKPREGRRNYRNGEARRAGFRDMEEIERKAGGGFLGVGACRGRTTATVKLPGKRINNESRARVLGIELKEKSGR